MKTIPVEVTCLPLKAWAWDDSLFGILSWRLSEQRIPHVPCNMPSLKIGSQKGKWTHWEWLVYLFFFFNSSRRVKHLWATCPTILPLNWPILIKQETKTNSFWAKSSSYSRKEKKFEQTFKVFVTQQLNMICLSPQVNHTVGPGLPLCPSMPHAGLALPTLNALPPPTASMLPGTEAWGGSQELDPFLEPNESIVPLSVYLFLGLLKGSGGTLRCIWDSVVPGNCCLPSVGLASLSPEVQAQMSHRLYRDT